jgi:tetratricopeptide (TPR) repeat protein
MKMTKRRTTARAAGTLVLAVALVWVASSALSQQDLARARVVEGVDAYTQAMQSAERDLRLGDFERAEQLFAAAAAAGAENAALQTNLGNAALQAEHLGSAIVAYRRALMLDPGYAPARQNLAHVRRLMAERVPTPPEAGVLDSFFFWHRTLSRPSRENLAALAFALGALLLAASIHLGVSSLRYAAAAPAAVWLVLQISVALDPARDADRQAVVVVPEVSARAADSINAPRRFSEPLPDGTELEILEDRGGWLHIQLHNGRDAWLMTSAVERIEPAPTSLAN